MKFLSVAFFSLVLSVSSYSQHFAERFFNPAAGLDGTFVFSMTQDKDNYLWLGTERGLIKYDGKVFQQISELDSTETDPVTAAFSDDQFAYFGFQNGKILRWDGLLLDTLVLPENENVIREIHNDENGNIWFLSSGLGLLRHTTSTKKIDHFQLPDLSGILSYDFIIDGNEAFVGTSDGVMLYDISSDPIFKGMIEGMEYVPCLSLEPKDVTDGYWVGTDDDGLYEISGTTGNYKASKTIHLQQEAIVSLDHAPNGDLWVGTRLDGLIRINFNLNNPKPIQYSYFTRNTGFPSNQIGKIYTDHEDNVWVGFLGDGMVQLYERAIQYFEFRNRFRITAVNATIQNNKHETFYATDKGLIKGEYPNLSDTLVFSLVRHPLLEGKELTDLEFDADSNIWIGTNDGIVITDQFTSSFSKLDVTIPSIESLRVIKDIQSDKFGTMWVAGRALGILEINRNRELVQLHNLSTGFSHNEIETIAEDRDGNIWTGAHSSGLAIIKIDGTYDLLSKDGIFPSRDVNSIARDKYGNMWIATQGNGVFEYNGEEFIRFNTKNGILSDFCDAVVEDIHDHIWVSHRKGLTRIDEITGAITVVQKKDGLIEDDFIIGSAYHDAEGNIWLGNRNGVTLLSSPHKTFQHDILETLVTNVRINFQNVDLKNYTLESEYQSKVPLGLDFLYDENHVTFDFIAINLRNPKKNVYQFKLDGIEESDWAPVTDLTSATFTNLDPGRYIFNIRQSDNPNFWTDENIQNISFRVQRPYWKKWWFTSFELLFLALLTVMTYLASTRSTNVFFIRLMIYVSLFIIFEYIHTLLEPYIEAYSGGAPIFQVMVHLVLALVLFPVERTVVGYIKRHNERKTGATAAELDH